MTCLLCILDLFHRCCKTVFSSSPAPIAIAECDEPNKQKCEEEKNEWIEAAFVAAHENGRDFSFFFGWELIWWCCDSQRQWSWWWWNENFGFIFRNGDVFRRLPEWIFRRFFFSDIIWLWLWISKRSLFSRIIFHKFSWRQVTEEERRKEVAPNNRKIQ